MPKSKQQRKEEKLQKKKERSQNKRGPRNNGDNSDEEYQRNKEKNEAMKKISEEMGAPFILVDSSRGAENATVVLQPGQTREDLEKRIGMSLEEEAQMHMENKRTSRQTMARAGIILNPGPNGIYDASLTTKVVKGSPADRAGGVDHFMSGSAMGLSSMMMMMNRHFLGEESDEEEDYTEEATKHWPAWAKETLKPRDEGKKKKEKCCKAFKGQEDIEEKKKVVSEVSKNGDFFLTMQKKKDPQKQLPIVKPPPPEFPHPIVKWAQRNDLLFLTVCIQDCKNPEIKVEEDKLYFKGKTGLEGKVYEAEIKFLKEIDTKNSKYAIRDRGIEFALEKKESAPYWARLTKETTKHHWLKIDFDKWLDGSDGSSDESGSSDEKTWQPEDFMKSMSSLPDLLALQKSAKERKEMSSRPNVEKKAKESKGKPSTGSNQKWNPDADSDDSSDSHDSTDNDSLPELE